MEGKLEGRHGIVKTILDGKKVVIPIGAREMVVGKEEVKLPLPIFGDGKEVWMEGDSKRVRVGFEMEKGQVVLAKRR